MLARARMVFALLGFSLVLVLGACDDDDDKGDSTDKPGDSTEAGDSTDETPSEEVDGGW